MALIGLNEALLIGGGILVLLALPKALPRIASRLSDLKGDYREALGKSKDELVE